MHAKRVNITYTIISTESIFDLHYQHQFLELMRFRTFWILLLHRFPLVNEPQSTDRKTPLPKKKWLFHGVKFVMSTLQYIIVLRELYKFQTRKSYCWRGVNEYMSAVRYIFLRKLRYKFQTQKYICWNGDAFPKEFTMRTFCKHFTFDWPLELLHPKFQIFLCSSSRYSKRFNEFWIMWMTFSRERGMTN